MPFLPEADTAVRRPGIVSLWWQTIRPRTLSAAVVPVILGGALAAKHDATDGINFVLALVGASLLQILANLINDLSDGQKGVDADRVGPPRALASGWLCAADLQRGIALVAVLAVGCGVGLLWRSGWWVAVVGGLSLLAAWGYTGGTRPYGYYGLGDLAVFAFFGPIATAGTFRAVAGFWSVQAIWAGCIPGLLGAAILAVNNLRDRHNDAQHGKHTIAVRIGGRATVWLYRGELVSASILPLLLFPSYGMLVVTLTGLAGQSLLWRLVQAESEAENLNRALGGTAAYMLLFSLLVAAVSGWQ